MLGRGETKRQTVQVRFVITIRVPDEGPPSDFRLSTSHQLLLVVGMPLAPRVLRVLGLGGGASRERNPTLTVAASALSSSDQPPPSWPVACI